VAPERINEILNILDATYPDVTCALTHRSAWELLVATILSAQSTDVNVNKVTPRVKNSSRLYQKEFRAMVLVLFAPEGSVFIEYFLDKLHYEEVPPAGLRQTVVNKSRVWLAPDDLSSWQLDLSPSPIPSGNGAAERTKAMSYPLAGSRRPRGSPCYDRVLRNCPILGLGSFGNTALSTAKPIKLHHLAKSPSCPNASTAGSRIRPVEPMQIFPFTLRRRHIRQSTNIG